MSSDRIVGIDLGTTNSLVAFMQGESPVVIPGEDGLNLVPSVVALDEKNQPVIGNAARKYLAETPERAVYSIKRLMGRGVDDIQEELKFFPFRLAEDLQPGEVLRIKLGDKTFTPPEISALILRQLKRNAERFFAAPVSKAVITVPAYFNDAQRQATKDAGRIAGLEVLRLVNEPTAASLAYGLDKKQNGIVAVYDLGGGTFDISILRLHDGIFEVIATNGDTRLGGDDIDNLLITIGLDDTLGDLGLDLRRNAEAVQAIRKGVIEAKIALSSQPSAKLEVELPGGKRYLREINREQFEQLIQPIIDRTVGPCKQALKDAGLKPEQIDEVVLVGGSTRIPKVRALVKELFHRDPHTDLNPDEVVALGAAVQANILGGGSEATENMLLLDVTPLSLGIEVAGGVTDKRIFGVIQAVHAVRYSVLRRRGSMVRANVRSTFCKASVNSLRIAARWRVSISKEFLHGRGHGPDRGQISYRCQRNSARFGARAAQRQRIRDSGSAQLRPHRRAGGRHDPRSNWVSAWAKAVAAPSWRPTASSGVAGEGVHGAGFFWEELFFDGVEGQLVRFGLNFRGESGRRRRGRRRRVFRSGRWCRGRGDAGQPGRIGRNHRRGGPGFS